MNARRIGISLLLLVTLAAVFQWAYFDRESPAASPPAVPIKSSKSSARLASLTPFPAPAPPAVQPAVLAPPPASPNAVQSSFASTPANLPAQSMPEDITGREVLPPRPQPPLAPHVTDLGVIEFTDAIPYASNLNSGEAIKITAFRQPDGTLRLNMHMEGVENGHPFVADSVTVAAPGEPAILSTLRSSVKLVPKLAGLPLATTRPNGPPEPNPGSSEVKPPESAGPQN